MLFQLENTNKKDINKLLDFAKQNHLELSLIDDTENYFLPGKPLSEEQLSKLIESSRNSGSITLQDVHKSIRNSFNVG